MRSTRNIIRLRIYQPVLSVTVINTLLAMHQVDLESVEGPTLGTGNAAVDTKYEHQGPGLRIVRVFESNYQHDFVPLCAPPPSIKLTNVIHVS